MPLKPNSLSARLLLASALLLPLFIGLSGYFLDLAFQRSLLAGERERLRTNVYLLLAAAEPDAGTLTLPDALTEPRFSQINSGLYGFLYDVTGTEVWRSPSAALMPSLHSTEYWPPAPGSAQFSALAVDADAYYRFDYDIAWETDNGLQPLYRFSILHTQTEMAAELTVFRNQLWWLLGGLALFLLLTQSLIMRWGLRPLQTLAQHLDRVERGEALYLHGDYPREIRPVTANLNRVLQAERGQRERYRNMLADLAHSLKTPLAVLRGGSGVTPEIDEQITRMDQIISYQLQRAVVSAQMQTGQPVDVAAVIGRIVAALQKVYARKNIRFEIEAAANNRFYGAEPDLIELLGNILENAFKYGKSRVVATAVTTDEGLAVIIADDGPGVPEFLQQQILRRGARADTAQPGQGIGLAVAVDIVSSYRGSLTVAKSELGGAEFKIILPVNLN